MFIIRRGQVGKGFALGFVSVFGPFILYLGGFGSNNFALSLVLFAATGAFGGAVTAAMSRRRAPQGAKRGLLLAAVAWVVALAAWAPIMGAYMALLLFMLLPIHIPIGLLTGAVLGRLFGPELPEPGREALRRFRERQRARVRGRLTSPRSPSRI